MKIYFITYGNEKFKYSLKRITKEAKLLGFFTKVIAYSEKDLPLCILSSPLFISNRGGGYWLWKPYIIHKTLKQINEGDIIVYSDGGNSLLYSTKWDEYLSYLKEYDSIVFQYKENYDYGWSKYNSQYHDSPKLKYWTKKSTVDHFSNLFSDGNDWLEKNKVMSGLIFVKKSKKSESLIDEWLNNMLYFPKIVCDLFENEKNIQVEGFSENRHDQSILSILVRSLKYPNNVLILDEDFESINENQIVRTTRKVSAGISYYGYFKNRLKKVLNWH